MEVHVVAGARTAVGKGRRGALSRVRPDRMAAQAIRETLRRAPGAPPGEIGDLVLGCAMPEGEQGLNIARQAGLEAGLPVSVPAATVNRFCASGLQAIAQVARSIAEGECELGLAGGVESMSAVPMSGFVPSPSPELVRDFPDAYLPMGLTAERVAARWKVDRAAQDDYALESHHRAAAAQDAGRFDAEIFAIDAEGGRFSRDETIRRDSTPEVLAALAPAFAERGTVTAGNSSPVSDGAAVVLLASRAAVERYGLQSLGIFEGFTVVGLDPGVMGMGPALAIPRLLARHGIDRDGIARFEINEAFAAQVVPVLRELGLGRERVNPDGGAIALGHPLGCTGAKLALTLLYGLRRQGGGRGVVSMCVGGGMGAAGLFRVE